MKARAIAGLLGPGFIEVIDFCRLPDEGVAAFQCERCGRIDERYSCSDWLSLTIECHLRRELLCARCARRARA